MHMPSSQSLFGKWSGYAQTHDQCMIDQLACAMCVGPPATVDGCAMATVFFVYLIKILKDLLE